MKILITGGLGFVGSNLVKYLSEIKTNDITVLDNLFTGSIKNIVVGVKYIIKDTMDICSIFEEEVFEIVYHFGEYSRISTSFKDIDKVMNYNTVGTLRVVEMCKKWKAKLIYSASSSSLGNDGSLSPYSWTKSKNIELIKNYGKWFNLKYEICYFYNVYGKGQIMEGDYATVIGVFEKQREKGEKLTVVKPGTQKRDFTYIDDIISGIIKASEVNLNGEWHLRSGNVVSIIELAKLFNLDYVMIDERVGERFDVPEVDKTTKETLAWKPKMNLNYYISNLE